MPKIHRFPSIEGAQAAIEAAAKIDYTVCSDAVAFNPTDVVVVMGDPTMPENHPGVLYINPRGELAHANAAAQLYDKQCSRAAFDYIAERRAKTEKFKARERRNQIVRQIAEAIGSRASVTPGNSQWNDGYDNLHIDGDSTYSLTIREDRRDTGRWSSAPTGKYSVTVGDYGKKTRFPQRKDGSHNYAHIAELLVAITDRAKTERAAEQRRQENKSIITDELKESLGVLRYSIYASPDLEHPLRVQFKFDRCLTVDQAKNLAQALEAVGVKYL